VRAGAASIARRRLAALCLAGVLAPTAAWASDALTAPNPALAPSPVDRVEANADAGAGAGAYSVFEFDWTDRARQRVVPVRLYLPDSAGADAPVPLVVFSHGIGGSRRGYSYLGRHWAGRGYASLHLQHVGSDRSLWGGNPFEMLFRLQGAAQESEALARVADLRFALDRVLQGELGARLDATRIAAAGHSYGANTTLLAVGAQVQRDGRGLDLRDPRLRAAIVLSAPPFYGESEPRRILGAIAVPSLHVTATEDIIRIPGYYSQLEDRLGVFDATGGPRKTLAVFEGGSHSIFTDRGGTGGAQLNLQVKLATRALSLAFLDSVFKGDDRGLQNWPGQFAAIVARFTRIAP
jgi:dienelactone hydrolase